MRVQEIFCLFHSSHYLTTPTSKRFGLKKYKINLTILFSNVIILFIAAIGLVATWKL